MDIDPIVHNKDLELLMNEKSLGALEPEVSQQTEKEYDGYIYMASMIGSASIITFKAALMVMSIAAAFKTV